MKFISKSLKQMTKDLNTGSLIWAQTHLSNPNLEIFFYILQINTPRPKKTHTHARTIEKLN